MIGCDKRGHKVSDDKFAKDIFDGKFRETRMVEATDNWCGNYDGNKIALFISIFPDYKNRKLFNVSVRASGNDDTYMVLRMEYCEQAKAISIYNTWKKYIFDKVPD